MIRRLSALAVASAALIVAACGQQTDEAPADAGVVNLYTARHYASDEQIYDAFTEATGIQVRKIEVPADQLVERLKAEGAGSPADRSPPVKNRLDRLNWSDILLLAS